MIFLLIDGVRLNLDQVIDYRDNKNDSTIVYTKSGPIYLQIPVERLDQMIRECSVSIKEYKK
jgi:hypothetical protein